MVKKDFVKWVARFDQLLAKFQDDDPSAVREANELFGVLSKIDDPGWLKAGVFGLRAVFEQSVETLDKVK